LVILYFYAKGQIANYIRLLYFTYILVKVIIDFPVSLRFADNSFGYLAYTAGSVLPDWKYIQSLL